MLLEAVRIVADQLEDATYGVAAKLSGVPKDVGDTPSVTFTIVDETRDNEPARGRIPDGAASVVVIRVAVSRETTAQLDTSELRPVKTSHRIPVLIQIRYVGSTTSTAVRDLYYIWRAVGRSLEEMTQDSAAAIRTRNSAFLEAIVQDDGVPLWPSTDDKQVVLARQIVVQMRDNAPRS